MNNKLQLGSNSQRRQVLSSQATIRDARKVLPAASRSVSVRGNDRSRGSEYRNDAPVRLITKRPLPAVRFSTSDDISRLESETLRTKPTSSISKEIGPLKDSGFDSTVDSSATRRLSHRLTKISDSSFFHLFNNRIASSAEEVIILTLANYCGFKDAIAFAAKENWKLGARFYEALSLACSPKGYQGDQS